MRNFFLEFAWLAVFAWAAPAADEVKFLPGWNQNLFSKTYSGYIEVSGKGNVTGMFEHYLYFESEGNPKTDPLIMWTNGGPGASSFFGSFSELGPYVLNDASLLTKDYNATGIPTLFENPFRWTKLGNLLIRNLPPPIGFSYCEPAGPAGDGYSCGPWNDSSVAEHSYEFLDNFINKAFPELQSRDLYLTGESYAGVYLPMLAQQITDVHPEGVLAKMLKGFAVGDGCISGLTCLQYTGPWFRIQFFHGHGQFSTKTYDAILASCSGQELFNGGNVSGPCQTALDRMDRELGYSFAYNLYDECYDFNLLQHTAFPRWHEPLKVGGPAVNGLEARRQKKAERRAQGLHAAIDASSAWHMDGSPCGGTDVLPDWVNAPAVKAALHVAPNAQFFTGDNGVGFTYLGSEPAEAILDYYTSRVEHNIAHPDAPTRILIYNGDTDPGLNSFVGEDWTSALGFPELQPWRAWTRDGKNTMGGYVTRYKGDFDYLTIRGSGHMVPEYKPEAASVMLQSFLDNRDYPVLKPQ